MSVAPMSRLTKRAYLRLCPNFRNSLQIIQKSIGQMLVKNRKRFQIFRIPEYLEQEETLLYLNKNCT